MRSNASTVVGAEIRRRAHAAQKDGDVTLRQSAQDGVERGARHLRLDPAQHVVGAELEDDRIGALRHRPVQPRQPVGGGIAGDAGIGDLGGDALAVSAACRRGTKPSLSGRPYPAVERIRRAPRF